VLSKNSPAGRNKHNDSGRLSNTEIRKLRSNALNKAARRLGQARQQQQRAMIEQQVSGFSWIAGP
jgi:hypothetical protein